MKRFIFYLVILTVCSLYFFFDIHKTYAGNNNYVSLFGSVSDMIGNSKTNDQSFIDKKVKNRAGWGGSIEMGQKFGRNIRFGLQYGFHQMRITNKVRTYIPSVTNGNIGDIDPYQIYINPITQDPFDEPGLLYVFEGSDNLEGKTKENTPPEIWNRNATGTLTARVVDNGDGTYTKTEIFEGSYKKNGQTIKFTEIRMRNTWRVDGKDSKPTTSNFSRQDELRVHTLMANAYWDWHFGSWSPYVGGGAGVAQINKGKDYNFAWQAKVGIGYFFTDNWKASIGATYLNVGEVQFEEETFDIHGNLETVQANVGLTYLF